MAPHRERTEAIKEASYIMSGSSYTMCPKHIVNRCIRASCRVFLSGTCFRHRRYKWVQTDSQELRERGNRLSTQRHESGRLANRTLAINNLLRASVAGIRTEHIEHC